MSGRQNFKQFFRPRFRFRSSLCQMACHKTLHKPVAGIDIKSTFIESYGAVRLACSLKSVSDTFKRMGVGAETRSIGKNGSCLRQLLFNAECQGFVGKSRRKEKRSERIDADPETLQRLGDRLNTIYSLEMKHKAADMDELLAKAAEYERRLAAIDNSDSALRKAAARVDKLQRQAEKAAAELPRSREAVGTSLCENIVATLARLGIADARFVVEIEQMPSLTPSGSDRIAFLFSANARIEPQSIERTASGGEISRVMLALKSLLARHSKLPTIVFDEIDTGVSGRIADAMGRIISELASTMQVVDITHLPQVASKGSAHFVVYKRDGRTSITRLDDAQREIEIAKMLSGTEITEAARSQARILLGRNDKRKAPSTEKASESQEGRLF